MGCTLLHCAEHDQKDVEALRNAPLGSREITGFITTPVNSPTIQPPLGSVGDDHR